MGGSSSVPSTTDNAPIICELCTKSFQFLVPNVCEKKFCLMCTLNHIQVCKTCSKIKPSEHNIEGFHRNRASEGTYDEVLHVFQYATSQIKGKQEHIERLEEQFSSSDHTITSLRRQIKTQQEKINKLERDNNNLETRIEEILSDKDTLDKTLAQLTIKNANLQETCQMVKDTLGDQSEELVDAVAYKDNLYLQLRKLKEEALTNTALLAQQRNDKEEVTSLRAKVKQLEMTVYTKTLKGEEQMKLLDDLKPLPLQLKKLSQEMSCKNLLIEQQQKALKDFYECHTKLKNLEMENEELKNMALSPRNPEPGEVLPSTSRSHSRGGRRGGTRKNMFQSQNFGKSTENLIKLSKASDEENEASEQMGFSKNVQPKVDFPDSVTPVQKKKYFLDFKTMNGIFIGKVVIETQPDYAPEMSRVFHDYVTGQGGIYLKTQIAKASPDNYIVIQNALVKGEVKMYPADKNDLEIKRGAVGMRIQGFEKDKKLVKSQFYIVLNESRPSDGHFSYVFGYVTEGLLVCDAISKWNLAFEKVIVSDLGSST